MTLPPAFLTRPITHRGLHDRDAGRPENSMAAFQAAIDGNYGIELDLQLTKDAAALVFHDYHLARLTADSGPVAQRSADEMAAIPLSGGDAGAPTLQEVLALVDGQVPILIEIKDQDGQMGANVGPLERATAKALEGYTGDVAVMSFNPHAVQAFGAAAPHIPRGLVTSAFDHAAWAPLAPRVCDALRDIPDYDRVGATFISHEAADLDRPRVAALKAAGTTVLCWTIKSAAQEAAARKVADNVTFEGYLA